MKKLHFNNGILESSRFFYPDPECTDDWDPNCGTDNGRGDESPAQSEDPYDRGTFIHGYSQLSGVYIIAQEGTTIETDVNITVDMVPEQQLLTWKTLVEEHLDDEKKNSLKSIYETQGQVIWFVTLWKLLYGNDQSNLPQWDFSTFRSEDLHKLAEAFYNITIAKFSIKGKIAVTGVGPGPAEASVFIEQAKIKFQDNRSFNFINTRNPRVETLSGQIELESVDLNIIPIQ